jgi:hypothetical protein
MRRAFGASIVAGCLGLCTGAAAAGNPALTLIHADQAWLVTRGVPAMRIAVIDTGVDYTHPDLQGRVVDGVDLGDGDDDAMDEVGHGTAVAGIVAAVCPRCSLLAVKIFSYQALGTPYGLLRRLAGPAIRWAVNHGARVVTVSDALPRSSELLAAVDYALAHRAVVVAAAGNGDDWHASYPAAYGPTVSVGAVDSTTGSRDPYSAFGPFLDITAPSSMTTASLGGLSTLFAGTSAAAPAVSGALGLLLSEHPDLSAEQAVALLRATAADKGVPGADDDYGAGVVDADALVSEREGSHMRTTCALPQPSHGAALRRPIVFVSSCGGSFDVYAMREDGSDVQRLTRSPALERHPALSPGGRRIAFLRGDFAKDDLYAMHSDGTHVRRLTHFEGGVESPAWSADGSMVAFSAYERQGFESKGSDIYTVRADGSHLHRVTRLGDATDPAWAPDGKRIVFATIRYGDLFVMSADGRRQRQLTRAPPGFIDVDPTWSPDGGRIAFARRNDSSGDVFVIEVGGSRSRRITNGGDCASPAWSPNGRRILFSARFGGTPDIYSVAATGTQLRPLLRTPASEVEVGSR